MKLIVQDEAVWEKYTAARVRSYFFFVEYENSKITAKHIEHIGMTSPRNRVRLSPLGDKTWLRKSFHPFRSLYSYSAKASNVSYLTYAI